jgi:hypothetical protein
VATTVVTSSLYLSGTERVNVQPQHAPPKSCAGQTKCPAITSTVRWWLLGIARRRFDSRRPNPHAATRVAAQSYRATLPGTRHTAGHALAGRAGLRDGRLQARAQLDRVRAGCGIPPTSRGATTRRPGGRATRGRRRSHRGLPPGRRAVRATPGRRDATRAPARKITTIATPVLTAPVPAAMTRDHQPYNRPRMSGR